MTDIETIHTTVDVESRQSGLSELTVYGTFNLAGAEFALSATSIQEVVNQPMSYSRIPLSPDYLLGVFNLRGTIVPVIDLRKIFSLDEQDANEDARKVAILEHGDLCLGVLFDATGEIINSSDAEMSLFGNRQGSAKDRIVEGVFKMDDGKRIVQILDVHGMLGLEKIPQSRASSENRASKHRGSRQQCISFYIGDSCCALDINSIREIVDVESIDNTILASELCIGAIDLRGDTVPIVNTSVLMGYECDFSDKKQSAQSSNIIVIAINSGLVGLLVDSIENIVTYHDDELIEFPVLTHKKAAMFLGCVPSKNDDQHTIVLETSELLSSDEVDNLTRGHSKLFNQASELDEAEKDRIAERKTIITFTIDKRYGLNIEEVREVLDYPENLIHTPTMGDNISGVANLRGELVPIIDSRKLYGMSSAEHPGQGKVLIFEQNGTMLGLEVDSIDSITSYCKSEVASVPRIAFRSDENDLTQDVKEAVMLSTTEKTEEAVCILDLEAVSIRAAA